MIYQIDRTYDFRVLPGSVDDEFFQLRAEGPDGPAIVKLGKLQFQRFSDYVCPSVLSCRVKSINHQGLPVLTHAIAPYVFELYESTFAHGDTFEAEVISVPDNPAEEPYMLRDRNGIFFRHNEPEGLLVKGQKVRCRFTRLTPGGFRIERVDEGAKLPFHSLAAILEAIGASGAEKRYAMRLVETSPELEGARAELAAKNPLWLLTATRTMLEQLPEWLGAAQLPRQCRICRRLLGRLRDALLYLLEGSGFLNAVSAEHRRALRQQLTEMVESIDPFTETLHVIERGAQDGFVESILDKLQRSGYLYHPKQQFAVMMLIFRRYPGMVGVYLSRIFESIFGRDLENWKREPFRSAFVEQFRIYVSQARREVEALPMAETREQKIRLETIITAIALQLLLSDADNSRTEALFYRYVSLLRPLNSETLLSKAFLSLMGSGLPNRLNYAQLKEPMMMMTQATVMPENDLLARISTTHRYSNGGVDLTVSSQGIQLSVTGRRDIADRVIPEGAMEWLAPQVFVDGVKSLSGSRMRKLADHSQWWGDMEKGLFAGTTVDRKEHVETVHERRRAERGDEVYIVIDSIDDYFDNNPTFNCHIEDNLYDEGTGILKRDQIVGYNLKQPSDRSYRSSDGSKLGFLATVLDERPDGSYIFSLRDEIDRYIDEIFNLDDEYVAIVAGINERDYSAISRDGIGLFLEKDPKRDYHIGDIVHCRLRQTGKQGQNRAYILYRSTDSSDKFDKTEAFASLMQGIGVAGPTAGEGADDMLRDIDELLSPDEVRELIAILRFKAITDTDLIKAYDYLRFARLIALTLSDEALAERLGTHAALLTLHQYYASNSRIDADKLEALKGQTAADPLLKMIYHRLEMVSWLDHPERNAELYATTMEPSNELEGSIARMVLSYNLLHISENDADSTIASEIKQQIMKRLNVNNETRRGKYYGSESKYLEFKTSIVYPATTPGKGMREDPEAQQFHILSRIAGMLNAKGGRLYLGVNDDGYEVGMHDDFQYFERHNVQAGNFNGRIKTIGQLQNYLENLIDVSFDKKISTNKIDVFVDDEAEKGVVYIDIAESLEPVFLEGRLFVRQSGQATYEYRGEDIDEFVREREDLRNERAHSLAASHAEAAAEAKPAKMPAPKAETASVDTGVGTSPAEAAGQAADRRISTSRWLPNVLHSYETGYADPAGYIYFIGESTLQFSTKDLYLEPEADDCRLALAIAHELADGYLILAYENERVLRIPLSEIYEKGENNRVEYNSTNRLMFAAIASKDDLLICVGADGSDALWKRANRISQIEASHLTSSPHRLHDAPIHHTVLYEIAAPHTLTRFADSLADKLAGRRFGTTMRVKETAPGFGAKIEALVSDCHIPV